MTLILGLRTKHHCSIIADCMVGFNGEVDNPKASALGQTLSRSQNDSAIKILNPFEGCLIGVSLSGSYKFIESLANRMGKAETPAGLRPGGQSVSNSCAVCPSSSAPWRRM